METSEAAPTVGHTPEPEADEPALLAQCRDGDTAAFRILVERHRNRAYGLALRILRSEQDAEEVAQDAFVRAWLGLREFRGDASFSTWLYRIVARRALDRAAILRGRRAREETLEGVDGPSVAGGSTGADSRRVARLMESLSVMQRGVVSLFYFDERPIAEIAILLEMPEGTVKTHLSRARTAMRQEWQRRARLETENEV